MVVSIATLGCKVNQFDAEALAELFRARGHTVVPFPAPADAYVINTCAVTAEAVRKSRNLARRIHRRNPAAAIALTGCYAQTGGDEPAGLPGVVLVVGPQDRGLLPALLEEAAAGAAPVRLVRPSGTVPAFIDLPVGAFDEHTRAWLKIQDGCEQFCAYCLIPYARGPVRSLAPERVLEEARRLTAAGHRELVLTGIHLGCYGRDLPGRPTLAAIVRDLEKVPGLARLRLGSVEPNDLTPALLDALASSRVFCPHLHLPLQSGEDATLASMRRPYRAADYAALLDELRAAIPGIAISTDLLVGFPGETEEQFAASLAFAAEMRFSRLHVFPYSRRPGTPAASFPGQLPRQVREERGRRAAALAERLALEFNRTLVGRTLEVLVEEWQGGTASGLAGEYVTVRFPAAKDLRNRIVRVVGETAAADGVAGRPR